MSVNTLIKELKENNEDFEFYPTTKAMLKVIAPYMKDEKVLDIGCGTCNFKKFMDEIMNEEQKEKEKIEEYKEEQAKSKGEVYYRKRIDCNKISEYYVMEKSKILLNKLDENTICLGTDFNANTLLDKKVSTIFCNPPYSEFENWTKRIISEGNFKQAFLIIPQRWQNNIEIKNLLEKFSTRADILGSFDFFNAERAARAKVDVIRLVKNKYNNTYYNKQTNFEEDAFNIWFEDTFNVKSEKELVFKFKDRKEKEKKEKISNALVNANKSKASILVDLYQNEYNTLIDHLKKIMELDANVLETFGFSVEKVKEGLKSQIIGLKTLYWDMVFNEFEEITSRLTYKSRNEIKNNFDNLNNIDFTLENIYVIILWVVKNANKYYNSQLIAFFKDLSSKDNVKPYKSNQRLFEKDGYYWNADKKNNYVLDYRIIMSSPFRYDDWHDVLDKNEYQSVKVLQDILTIARNLGFETGGVKLPNNFGEKTYIYMADYEKIFMEYKVYKNGNMHVKFNQEFTKAMNVEVSRLLGWIRTTDDIKNEFPAELAKGAEKYFKVNKNLLVNNNLKLLTCS